MNIQKFNKINRNDVPAVGGKGASLGEMMKFGLPVPDGFVIVSEAFERFLKEAKINNKIDDFLHSVNQNKNQSVEDASNKIDEFEE